MVQTQISLMGNDNICDEIGFLGLIYGQLGQKDNAYKQLERLENLSQNGFYIPSRAQLYVQIGLGNYDKAIDILEKAYIDHSITIATIKKSLVYNFLFKDPRYNELLKKLGF
jgi:tetratricopeptide (TPR) repeat protein